METALATLDRLFTDLTAVQLEVLSSEHLGCLAVDLGRGIDRLTAFHAKVVHAVDERRAWAPSGARNVDEWLASRTGTSRGTAASRRKLGEALGQSKKLDDAVANGDLSAEAATQLHDAITNPPQGADASDVDELIDAAKGAGPRETREAAERWREIRTQETPEERTARRYAKRSLTSTPPIDGMVTSTLVLPEVEHRQVWNAIGHAAGAYTTVDDRTTAQRMADGLVELCKAYAAGTITGGREKPTLLIGCTADTIAGISAQPGWTAHGDRVPADVVRHLAENAVLRKLVSDGNQIVELSKKIRFATDEQYQALMMRDGGCRMPECDIPPAWCEVDHLIPVEVGGVTELWNLALWCTYHHHFKHRSDVQVIGDANDLSLKLPDGRIIHCPPKGQTIQQPPEEGRPGQAAA